MTTKSVQNWTVQPQAKKKGAKKFNELWNGLIKGRCSNLIQRNGKRPSVRMSYCVTSSLNCT